MTEPTAEGVPTAAPAEALAQAGRLAGQNEWSQAADILATAGRSTELLDKRSFYLSRAKRYEEALDLLAVLRDREPGNFLWFYMTAYQFYVQERYAEAVPWFREALRRNPDHLTSWWRAANALSKSGEELKAVQCAARVLRLWHDLPEGAKDRVRPSFGKASYLLGKHQMKSDPHAAVPLLQQALEADPHDPHRHYRLGKALRYARRAEEALPHLREAAKLKRDDQNIDLELAIVLARTDEVAEAEKLLRNLEPRLRGWDLLKGGSLALEIERSRLAVSLLERAARDRATRGDERLAKLLTRARDAAKDAPPEEAMHVQPDVASTGRVEVVNEERNFGFLVDEAGTRRHFRLSGLKVRRGQRVHFTPLEAKKGPAARDLTPL
jgi:cold shock CspA family protein/thioredoxin-like negative regulator of GroEL